MHHILEFFWNTVSYCFLSITMCIMHLPISEIINFLLWLSLVLAPLPEQHQWPARLELGTFSSPPFKSWTPLVHPTWPCFLWPVHFSLSPMGCKLSGNGGSTWFFFRVPRAWAELFLRQCLLNLHTSTWRHNFSYNSLSCWVMTYVHPILQTHNIDLFNWSVLKVT